MSQKNTSIVMNISHGGPDNRPAFQKMLADIGSGDFPDILITKDTSRLAKNELQTGTHKERIRLQGIEIRFVLQDFGEGDEGGSPNGKWT